MKMVNLFQQSTSVIQNKRHLVWGGRGQRSGAPLTGIAGDYWFALQGKDQLPRPVRSVQFSCVDTYTLLSAGPELQLLECHFDTRKDDMKRWWPRPGLCSRGRGRSSELRVNSVHVHQGPRGSRCGAVQAPGGAGGRLGRLELWPWCSAFHRFRTWGWCCL